MSAFLVGNPTIGTIWAAKTLNYNNQQRMRPGEKNRSLTGATIHQVGVSEDSDREISGTIRVSETNKSTLFSMLSAATDFILTLQDGEDVFLGYLKSLTQEAQPAAGRYRYAFTFFVTEKLT